MSLAKGAYSCGVAAASCAGALIAHARIMADRSICAGRLAAVRMRLVFFVWLVTNYNIAMFMDA